VQPEGVTS